MHRIAQQTHTTVTRTAVPFESLRQQVALSAALHGIVGDLFFYRSCSERALSIKVLHRVLTALTSDRNGRVWTVDDLRDTLNQSLAAGGENL